MLTAVRAAVPRSFRYELLASTRTILQFGHSALTICVSSELSWAHPVSGVGYDVPPFWFTFLKQPLAVVHAGRPKFERYVARSLSAFGLSYAMAMATVCPDPPVADGALYADRRYAGSYAPPLPIVADGAAPPAWVSVRTCASQYA